MGEFCTPLQIINGFIEGNNIDQTFYFAVLYPPQPLLLGQKQDFQQITHTMGHADDIAAHRLFFFVNHSLDLAEYL